jgi:minor extracellular serine protease Vpr
MNRAIILFLAGVAAVTAQTIPGRYIVEFNADPAVAVAIAAKVRAADARPQIAARRTEILATHAPAEAAVRALGGRVTRHYDTLLNGMVVEISDKLADRLRALPGVRGVYPDSRMKPSLNYALEVHRIPDAWATLPGGPSGAGAGIKIGIIDSGIDVNHPGFQGFTTAVPSGYPMVSDPTEVPNTNNKIIVSRDYTGSGGMDTDGHGTGNAMAAAGLTNNASVDYLLSDNTTVINVPLSPITGAAPGAWLGNYKVCDTNGCATSAILQALQDAVNDGMSVVSCSIGQPVTDSTMESGPEARVVRNAVAAGLVVVVSAGNDGQSPGTIEDPAVVPDTIAVGAIGNARIFDTGVLVPGQPPLEAAFPDISNDINLPDLYDPITGTMVDVATIDTNGYGCNALPANSLMGTIALIQRSPVGSADACSFDQKLGNAMTAGAAAAVIYNSVPDGVVFMQLQTASLPALFLQQSDGQALKAQIAANSATPVTLDFTGLSQFPASANFLAYYSSTGPTPGGNIKPDMVAVGGGGGGGGACYLAGLCYPSDLVLTANATSNNPNHPYNIVQGTSLASPIVAGGVAMVMGARPGLTGAQYKSLVVNSTPQFTEDISGVAGSPALVGTGKLDVMAALQNNLTVAPVSVNFGTASGGANVSQSIVVTNIGSAADTFSVTANPIDGGVSPTVDVPQFTLAPGASQTLNVSLAGAGFAAGAYDGYLLIQGTQTTVATRAGYWFGVPGSTVQSISVLNGNELNEGGSTGGQSVICVRLTDQAGIPVGASAPTVTAVAARARVVKVTPLGDIPGTFAIQVVLGRVSNIYDEFDVTAGGVMIPVYVPVF